MSDYAKTYRAVMRVRDVRFGRRYEVAIREDTILDDGRRLPDPSFDVWGRYWTRAGALESARRQIDRLAECEARYQAIRNGENDVTLEVARVGNAPGSHRVASWYTTVKPAPPPGPGPASEPR